LTDRFRTVGHRGASALAPENTLRAIRVAIEYRLDFVEVDVHLSREGELVVHHDPDLVTEQGVRLPVAELTVAELARVPKGDGEFVPTLAEVFAVPRPTRSVHCFGGQEVLPN
jgi:glycerophosphoryl diester phosphodiesterase